MFKDVQKEETKANTVHSSAYLVQLGSRSVKAVHTCDRTFTSRTWLHGQFWLTHQVCHGHTHVYFVH